MVAGFEDAQQRWQVIRSKGKTRGYIALAVVAVLVIVIALVARSNAAIVVAGLILVIVAVAVVLAIVGKQRSGLSLSPEWKPETDEFDDDDENDENAGEENASSAAGAAEPSEPVRRLDAQILGADLSKLGQVVQPALAKSYAVGTLILENNKLIWEPGASSKAKGIEALTMEPGQVASVEQGALWGSWALLCVAGASDEEWCMRVPGSVDLSDAFAELGLTLRNAAH